MINRIAFVLTLLYSSTIFAAPIDLGMIVPKDLEQVDFYLVTVDQGEELYTRFGHTLIRMIDHASGKDISFNWGMFSFEEPFFALKFFRGTLTYFMGVTTTNSALRLYKNYEFRTVWQNQIDLSLAQKKVLLNRIIWNAKPENIGYRYQYFFNNCATKVRDYLDEALGGAIKSRYEPIPADGREFRDHVRSHLASNPVVVMGLDIMMNSRIDHSLNKWEEMFLPKKLQEYLEEMPTGQDSYVLSERELLVGPYEHPPAPFDGYVIVILLFGLPLMANTFRLLYNKNSLSTPGRTIYGIVFIFWFALSGFFGLTMTLSWIFSDHLDLHRNINLLFFWPIDFIGIIFGIKMMMGKGFAKWQKIVKGFCIAHMISIAIYFSIFLGNFTTQNISRVVSFMIPLSILVYLFIYRQVSRDA